MLADHLPDLLLAWSIQIMGVISPGPSVLLILGVATRQGRAPSLITALGVACGSIILSSATVVGLAALFAEMASLMTVVRLVGAAYLAWLAYRAFRNIGAKPHLEIGEARSEAPWRTGLKGFLLQVTNPKAIFFWLAIASIGGVGEAPLPVIVLFVAGAFINSFVGHGAYALLLSSGPIRRAYMRFHGWIEGALGCFFVFASIRLATAKV